MNRRDFLKSTLALGAAPLALSVSSTAASPAAAKNLERFDFARLKGDARALAGQPYRAPENNLPRVLADLSYDQYQSIRFRESRAQWANTALDFRLEFFSRGPMFKQAVRIYEVVNGRAREILFDPAMFDLRKLEAAAGSLSKNLGFAGFRVHYHTYWRADVAAFLGASYFRAVGEDYRQYGLSARGLAVDTALDHGEEFPRFSAFWFERPALHSGRLTVYGLLDSPSITGAYRFDIAPGATLVMDVDAALYPRKTIERLGVAPLTSMFQYGENDRRMANDWRPEIHDSDGLLLWTGAGEWMWRPLINPNGVRVNSFIDVKPRGFGLLQRDRLFDHYQDDGAFYQHRPSLWVEPKNISSGGWGKGAVQLIELPAPDETHDNVVAFWNPAEKPQRGQELLFSYRLYWGSKMPFGSPLAQVVATRSGIGGVVGRKRTHFSWRFVVDFAGGELAALPKRAAVEPVISASRGEVEITSARPQFEISGYRAMFDLKPTVDSIVPIDLRLYLRLDDQPLTETWCYQWTPPSPAARLY